MQFQIFKRKKSNPSWETLMRCRIAPILTYKNLVYKKRWSVHFRLEAVERSCIIVWHFFQTSPPTDKVKQIVLHSFSLTKWNRQLFVRHLLLLFFLSYVTVSYILTSSLCPSLSLPLYLYLPLSLSLPASPSPSLSSLLSLFPSFLLCVTISLSSFLSLFLDFRTYLYEFHLRCIETADTDVKPLGKSWTYHEVKANWPHSLKEMTWRNVSSTKWAVRET